MYKEQFIKEYGECYSSFDAARFVDRNWGKMTGLSNRDKDEEGYFPDEVETFIEELEIDMDDFSQEWGDVREGAEDWEDEDED
ncbi:hypothetical protein KY334_01535 [Candidatus Woesearchaeota archaeon]|nr:hypothetical protein [Candidatus Woesearchaeota archaeon]